LDNDHAMGQTTCNFACMEIYMRVHAQVGLRVNVGSSQPCCLRETGVHRYRSGPPLEKIAAIYAVFGKRMRQRRAEVQFRTLGLYKHKYKSI